MTCSNLPLILEEFERLKGQLVLTESWKIERFVGIGDDGDDWYYITYDGRKFTWNTCVGRLIQLKGKIDDRDYEELVRIARLNEYDFKITPSTDEIVAGLYMDIV